MPVSPSHRVATVARRIAPNPVDDYAQQVAQGYIPGGKYHRLACVRHLRDRDREHDPDFPFVFKWDYAKNFIDFAQTLRHYKGRQFSGQEIRLSDSQIFRLGSIFGWRHKHTWLRRFTTAYNELPRKSGKTLEAAIVAVYVTFFEGEPGAEGYCIAPLDLATEVPTPSGWTTMGQLRVGDEVFDDHGRPTRVTYLSPIRHTAPCYRIVFNDGSTVIADDNHRWSVLSTLAGWSLAGTRRSEWPEMACSRKTDRHVLTTAEIAETIRTPWGERNHCIPVCKPLKLPTRRLPIPPYTLGVWLGDGRSNRGSIVLHENDRELLDHVGMDGFSCSVKPATKPGNLRATILGLRTLLRTNGLLNNKHVPEAYLRSSIRQRRALLQGLMDTDGTATTRGECRFTNRNEKLADAVYELAVSLGLLPWKRQNMVNGAPHYSVSFRAPSQMPVFALRRKHERQRTRWHVKSRRRYIDRVERVESRPVRCISVAAESSLFLVGRGMIATHNTKKDQARLVFDAAKKLVRGSGLRSRIAMLTNNMHRQDKDQKLEPLGADADSTDGLNPYLICTDEFHAHKQRKLVDVMESATGARLTFLHFIITTAGDDPVSPCGDEHDYACRILDGVLPDNEATLSYFAFIAHADPTDDWKLEATWRKANPHYGISVNPDDLKKQALAAVAVPQKAAEFQQKRLNLWVNRSQPSLSVEGWRAGQTKFAIEEMHHQQCWAGVDIGMKLDLCALSLLFPPAGVRKSFRLVQYLWTPFDTLMDRTHRDRAPYDIWVQQGWLLAPHGVSINPLVVRVKLNELRRLFNIQMVGFDPWHADQLAMDLVGVDGWHQEQIIEVPQTFAHLTSAEQKFKAETLAGNIDARGCPVTAWAVSNVVDQTDEKGNILFSKKRSRGRIDPVKSASIAMSVYLRKPIVAEPQYQVIIYGGGTR